MHMVCNGTGHAQVIKAWVDCKEMYMRAWYVLYSTDEGKLNLTFPVHFLIQIYPGNLLILPVTASVFYTREGFQSIRAN